MSKVIQTRKNISVTIEDVAFASGGEGDLFRILKPAEYANHVVKIFKPEKRDIHRQQKIEYLIDNPIRAEQGNSQAIIWIDEIVVENGKFAGIIIPYAKGVKLEFLCHPARHKHLPHEWAKFDFNTPDTIKLRSKICFNIAVAMYHLHSTERYVLVDMKPENVIIQPNGLISIIDIDSIGVVSDRKMIFKAPVATPEYSPPESYNSHFNIEDSLDDCWDRFSMAVIFYRLLCGIHPFTGSCNPPYSNCNGLAEMVQNGLFPNGNKRQFFKVVPPPHNRFKLLPANVQELFIACFTEGHTNPMARPSADDWCRVLAPPEITFLKRKLPSKNILLPAASGSNSLVFSPTITVNFPAVYLLPAKMGSEIVAVIKKIFGQSQKDILLEKIRVKGREINLVLKGEQVYAASLNNIISDFRSGQKSILDKEAADSRSAALETRKCLDAVDEKAKRLFEAESDERKIATQEILSKIAELKAEKSEVYKRLIEAPTTQFHSMRAVLEEEQRTLINRRDQDILRRTTDPDKLVAYSIKDNFEKIFGFLNVNMLGNLHAHGFVTAADVLDVNSQNGAIKDRKKAFVKVPAIGKVRAVLLKAWRDDLDKQENNNIVANANMHYNQELPIVNRKLADLQQTHSSYIAKAGEEYKLAAVAVDTKISKYDQDRSAITKTVSEKYNLLEAELIGEARNASTQLSAAITGINKEAAQQLAGNLEVHKDLFDALITRKNNDVSKLMFLIAEYNQLKAELHA